MHKNDAKTIISKLKFALEVKTDQELADKIEVPLGTILSWKGRNKIPTDRLLDVLHLECLSPRFILYNEGEADFEWDNPSIDRDAMGIAITLATNRAKKQGEIYPEWLITLQQIIMVAVRCDYLDILNDLKLKRESLNISTNTEEMLKKALRDRGLDDYLWWRSEHFTNPTI